MGTSFGQAQPASATTSGGLFGAKPSTMGGLNNTVGGTVGSGMFGNSTTTNTLGSSTTGTNTLGGGLFGNKAAPNNGPLSTVGGLTMGASNQPAINSNLNNLFLNGTLPESITQPNKTSIVRVSADNKMNTTLTKAYRLAPKVLFSTKQLASLNRTSMRSS